MHRLAYNDDDAVAFKMGRRQGGVRAGLAVEGAAHISKVIRNRRANAAAGPFPT